MQLRLSRILVAVTTLVALGCSSAPPPTIGLPTASPIPPTATRPLPTRTAGPTGTPAPPTATPLPATDTVCASGCGFTVIQAAIDSADASGGSIIEVRDPIHTEAGIVVDKDVTIRGLGADRTVVQSHEELEGSPDRVFLVEEGSTVVVERLTIRHGRPSARDDNGGGILNDGTLTVVDCIVTANAANGGAGICSNGALTVIDSSIRGNVSEGIAQAGLQCGSGAGILSRVGELTVVNSTISRNQAGSRSKGTGGGIRVGCKSSAVISNTTISGNAAVVYGGGVVVMGTARLVNCTIANNASKSEGGGVYVRGALDLLNTIVADNSGTGASCFLTSKDDRGGAGRIGTNRHNLIDDGVWDPYLSGDPMLGPLADNGGPTMTHALLPGSPAIDAVPKDGCALAVDQRGLPRAFAVTSYDTPCDIGAFEWQP